MSGTSPASRASKESGPAFMKLIRVMRNALDYAKIAPLNVLVSRFVSLPTAPLVQLNAQRRRAVHPRAVARCLARWGLKLVALRDATGRSGAGTAWLAAQPTAARGAGAPRSWWCGGLPAPAATAAGSARGLLVAVDARGQIAWLP